MKYTVKQHGPSTVLSLSGDVDMKTSPKARKLILQLLEKKDHLLVDLSATTYIDSSGVATLVEGLQLAKNTNLQFGLTSVSDAALQVLHLARLDLVFAIYESVEEGLTAFADGNN